MSQNSYQLKEFFWMEVAAKGRAATLAFTAFAVIVFFYHFHVVEYRAIVQAASVLVIFANVLRFGISRRIMLRKVVKRMDRRALRFAVFLNTIGWSTAFTFSAIELQEGEIHFVIMMTMMTGFLAASVITLAYDKYMFFPFQIIILGPLMTVAMADYLTGDHPYVIYLFFNYFIFFLYQCKQYKDYRSQLFERFTSQLQLQSSYAELKQSRDAFVEQSAKLLEASRLSALGEMAGGLAHEINNSMMVILGSTQQVERELREKGLLSGNMERKFGRSTDSIKKIKNIIESLKFFSQQMDPSPKERIRLRELIQRALNYSNELLKARGIRFELGAIPEVTLECHPFQIIHILFNLTKNAEHALMESVSPLKILKYQFSVEGSSLFIHVLDNGVGVPDEYRSKLFQPFFTTKDINKGTGLSLSVAKGIALNHRGDITYECREGFTCFTLKLPICSVEKSETKGVPLKDECGV